jgi:tetratricopeptide (TPR) repeat protein
MLSARDREELLEAGRRYGAGDLDTAEAMARRVLKRNPGGADAIQLLGLVAFSRNAFDEAMACYRKCIALAPNEPLYYYLLGKVHTIRGELDKAIAAFNKALSRQSNYRQAVSWKAVVLERRGDLDEARALVRPYVEAGTEDAEMAETWARLEIAAGKYAEAVAVIDRQLARTDLAPLSREVLGFVKARAYESAGQHDRAFEAYRQANDQLDSAFDPTEHVAAIDRLISFYTKGTMTSLSRGTNRSTLPVFIAGMPRSGTTLVEQIIDAAPDAHGAGEIKDFERVVASLEATAGGGAPYPDCVAQLSPAAVDRLAGGYLEVLRKLDSKAAVVTNKSLENYKQLGVVAQLLPGARVIHCRRDPMDTCLSCYFSHLMPGRHGYACDLENIALVYRQYERLMRHWADVLDIPILDVSYEQLVADQPTISRQIVEFCGLRWDDRCLSFHQSGRFAMTLSYDQVRRPIYSSSIGRHRRYERQLRPLRNALAAG